MNRREFLRSSAFALGAAGLASWPAARARSAPNDARNDPCLVLVLFGGGTRNSEAITDPEHRYIPRLWNDLRPQGTLFSNVRNDGFHRTYIGGGIDLERPLGTSRSRVEGAGIDAGNTVKGG